jgi:hypothetical protein
LALSLDQPDSTHIWLNAAISYICLTSDEETPPHLLPEGLHSLRRRALHVASYAHEHKRKKRIAEEYATWLVNLVKKHLQRALALGWLFITRLTG